MVTIPFNWINVVGNKVVNKNDARLTPRSIRIISEIRNNPNITPSQPANILGISMTAVEKNISYLKDNGYMERIRPNKTGIGKSRIDSFKMIVKRNKELYKSLTYDNNGDKH